MYESQDRYDKCEATVKAEMCDEYVLTWGSEGCAASSLCQERELSHGTTSR